MKILIMTLLLVLSLFSANIKVDNPKDLFIYSIKKQTDLIEPVVLAQSRNSSSKIFFAGDVFETEKVFPILDFKVKVDNNKILVLTINNENEDEFNDYSKHEREKVKHPSLIVNGITINETSSMEWMNSTNRLILVTVEDTLKVSYLNNEMSIPICYSEFRFSDNKYIKTKDTCSNQIDEVNRIVVITENEDIFSVPILYPLLDHNKITFIKEKN